MAYLIFRKLSTSHSLLHIDTNTRIFRKLV